MKQIGATKFKEKCLSLLEKVDKDGIVITKHGKPIAKLVPIETQPANKFAGLSGCSILEVIPQTK